MLAVTTMDFLRISKKKFADKLMIKSNGSVGPDLLHLEADKQIANDPGLNKRRKTINLIRENNSWGFTLQTYGVRHKQTNTIEIMTYVDYVEIGRAAFMAGLRRGDVIVSINGESVETATHQQLVQKIRICGDQMRLVVLFEDCSTKVELHERYIKLKKVLMEKRSELMDLEEQEEKILQPYYEAKGVTPLEWIRRNLYSTSSDGGDRYSIVTSLNTLINTPNCPSWLKSELRKSSRRGDDSSDPFDPEDSHNLSYIDSDSVSTSSGIAVPFMDQSDCSSQKSADISHSKFQTSAYTINDGENKSSVGNGIISYSEIVENGETVSNLSFAGNVEIHDKSTTVDRSIQKKRDEQKNSFQAKLHITVICVTNLELNKDGDDATLKAEDSKLEDKLSLRVEQELVPQTETLYVNEEDEDTQL